MSHNFAEIVEEVKQLSTEEKEELQDLLEKYLIDERRHEIYKNHQTSLKELHENRINFSSNVDELKEMLSHD
jgi:phosphopantothenate synthetase